MNYTNQTIAQLNQEIEEMYNLSMPNSAFRRVIPTEVKQEMLNQYIEYLNKKNEQQKELEEQRNEARPISAQVIKVNISSLREAGYCICPEELAAACEAILRSQASSTCSENSSEMNVPVKELQSVGKDHQTGQEEFESDVETTYLNSNNGSKQLSKATDEASKKQYPKKIGNEEFEKSKSSSTSHQKRLMKKKYFTKYMSDEFSKDTEPVDMSMMDSKTKQLFIDQDFNNLVSEITGIN